MFASETGFGTLGGARKAGHSGTTDFGAVRGRFRGGTGTGSESDRS